MIRAGVLILLALALFTWSQGHWPDPVIDFGRELYTPWQLSEGAHLYSDIAWFNGPLSAHFNGLVFTVFGASLDSLARVNLVLLLVLTFLLVTAIERWSTRTAATGAALVLLTVFGFSQVLAIGNYNYIAPYSSEIVHGVLLGLAGLVALQRAGRSDGKPWILLGGLCVGLALLTKVEVFLAAAVGVGLRAFLLPSRARTLPLFGLGVLLPPLISVLLLQGELGASGALKATLGSILHAGGSGVTSLDFYQEILGIDDIGGNLARLAGWGAGWCGLALILGALGSLPQGKLARSGQLFAVAAGAGIAFSVILLLRWQELATPWPLMVLLFAGFAAREFKETRDPIDADRLAFALWAGALMLKMALNVRLTGYGFALAMPATMIGVTLLLETLPKVAARRGANETLTRCAAAGVLLALAGTHLRASHQRFALESHDIEGQEETVQAHWRGPALKAALADLEERLAPGDTLLVLPEGIMLNFLLRTPAPTPFLNFMPPELMFWSEAEVVSALEEAPPRFVALVHKDTSVDYRMPWFGSEGFGAEIMTWVHGNYAKAATHGHEPMKISDRFGVEIWERR